MDEIDMSIEKKILKKCYKISEELINIIIFKKN